MTSPLSFACDPPPSPFFQCSPYQEVTSKIYRLKQHFLPLQPLEVLLKLNKLFQVARKLWSKPMLTRKGSKYRKRKSIHSYSLWLLYLNAYWYISKHCRLTIFLWVSVLILDFLDQQEKYVTSMICVTKLSLAVKAAFIDEILCFEAFKILFSQQLVDRMLENKTLHDRDIKSNLTFVAPGCTWTVALQCS